MTSRGRDDDFERNVDMFLLGVWRGICASFPLLQRRGGGSIVNAITTEDSSTSARTGFSDAVPCER